MHIGSTVINLAVLYTLPVGDHCDVTADSIYLMTLSLQPELEAGLVA
jgi:hypothetical protein